jgi:NitT/TauT family transport system permease protein
VSAGDVTAALPERRARRAAPRLYEPISLRVYVAVALFSMALLFGVWAAASYGGWVDRLFLPTPGQVWHAAVTEARDGTLWRDMRASVTHIVEGFLISTAVAIPVGVIMGTFKVGEAFFEPPVDFIRYMPAVAFVPLVLIWFGASDAFKLVILFIGIFFQEVLLITDNVKTVRRNLVDIAYTMGLRQHQVIRRVVLRSALPGIVDTLRISMGWAWTYLVVAELVGATEGLGFRIQQAQRYLDTPAIVLGIIVIGILGLAFDFSFKAAYAVAFPYMAHRGRR